MGSVGRFLFSNLVLPAIAVQAKETDIEETNKENAAVTQTIPTNKIGLGTTGTGHDPAPAFAARRNVSAGRQSSRSVDDASLMQELIAFRQWQSQQAGYTPRQITGGFYPGDGLRQRRTSGGSRTGSALNLGTGASPNIIIVQTGDNSAAHPSNLPYSQDPGQRPESAVQVVDGQSQYGTHVEAVPEGEEGKEDAEAVVVNMGDGQYPEVVKAERPPTPNSCNTVEHTEVVKKVVDGEVVDHVVTTQTTYKQEELYEAATQFYHRLLAEALGTWAVTFFIAGLVIESSLGHINQMGVAIGAGLVFVTLIYSLGQVSGAHFNPVVTFAFVLRGMFPLLWLPFYWIVQFVGAIIAAAMLLGFYGTTIGGAGATLVPDAYSQKAGFLMETVITFVLVFTILSMASRSKIVGPHAALAIGAVIAFNIMIAGSYSGASMNPWRSVCVSIVFPVSFYSIWVYFAGPFLGSTIAVLFVFMLAGKPRNDELSAGIGATIAVAVGNAISRENEGEAVEGQQVMAK